MSGWGDRLPPAETRCKRTDPHARHTWGTGPCPGIPDPEAEVSLRERVMDAIRRENATGGCDLAARAVLVELATWMKPRDAAWARIFRQEADRG